MRKMKETASSASPFTVMLDEASKTFHCELKGPVGSPYEAGVFPIQVQCPNKYPYKPPMVTTSIKVFHPNFMVDGLIHVKYFSHDWSPAQTVKTILLKIQELMKQPNNITECPVNFAAVNIIKDDYEAFCEIAQEWTKLFAMPEEKMSI